MPMRIADVGVIPENKSLESLADLVGTPFYRYHLPTIRAQIARLRTTFAYPVNLLFATMANDHPAVLRAIAEEGVGACVNSLHHLRLALDSGFAANDIQFTSTGAPLEDMVELQRLGIAANLDSPLQVRQWCSVKPGRHLGVRINAASLRPTARIRDRIGVNADGLAHAQEEARANAGKVNGLHLYAGTNIQRVEDIVPVLTAFFLLARQVSTLEYVNIGGGIGVDYAHSGCMFDYERFGTEVSILANELASVLGRAVRVYCEPGRSMVAEAGVFVTRVTDLKQLEEDTFVAVDGSVAVFPRPFHHPDNLHYVRALGPERRGKFRPVVIVGRTTFSRDILGRCELQELEMGDLLVFEDAGAYCQSMSSQFLGQKTPACVVADN